jgi:hypothetical protein
MNLATRLEQVEPALDARYVAGRCPTCRRIRLVPVEAPPRCWVCVGEPQPELPKAKEEG